MRRTILFCQAITAVVFAQAQTPTSKINRYEVVSVKRGVPGATACGTHFAPGEFRLVNCALPDLIGAALRIKRDRVTGLPPWALSETYSIIAKSITPASPSEQWAMLAPVLEDRFRLKYHRDRRSMRVYELLPREGGIQFPLSVPGGCQPMGPNDGAQQIAPDGPTRSVEPTPPRNCGRFLISPLREGGVRLTVKAVTMAQFAAGLQQFVDRPVVDRTGSSALFDIDFSFDNSDIASGPGGARPPSDGSQEAGLTGPAAGPRRVRSEAALPSLFTALKKVGLSLSAGRGDVEVLVIDRVERPSEN